MPIRGCTGKIIAGLCLAVTVTLLVMNKLQAKNWQLKEGQENGDQ